MSLKPSAWLILSLVLVSCGQSGKDAYAGWSTYVGPDNLFALRYLAPPWQECSGTDYEADCHECPAHLLSGAVCGGARQSVTLWIPPRLLDPEYLLIPPFKLEVTWFVTDLSPMEIARWERTVMERAGLEILIEPRSVTLHDGTIAAELGYFGPMHIIMQDDPVDRPDERGFRIVYVSEGGWGYRVALDTAVDITLPEARDMLASFTLDPPLEDAGE